MADNQRPRIRVVPASVSSYGNVAAELIAQYGMVLDEWQRLVIDDWLAVDDRGKYAASPCGLSVPRQNGKTALVKCRCVFGIVAMNETILYTAHEVKTAHRTFNELAQMFDVNGSFPELAAQVEYIRRANGQEEIKLKDYQDENGQWVKGGCIAFSARSRGASRGFTVDTLVLDEAQELTAEQYAALMPTTSAGENQNPQVIMLGTPPAPGLSCEVFGTTRERALGAEPGRTEWHEWSVQGIPASNDDWEAVEATNPALDIRLMRVSVEAEMNSMPRDYFARERLGWWSASKPIEHPIDPASWDACTVERAPEGLICYAVKFSPDGSTVSLSVAVKPDAGAVFVEGIENRSMANGTAWLVEWLMARKDKAAQVVIDGKSGAQPLVDRLAERGFPKQAVIVPRTHDVIAACSAFKTAVQERTVSHISQPAMAAAVSLTRKRKIGSDGGWGFETTEQGDATLAESAALAFWAVTTTKRKPGRKAIVW